MFSLFTRTKSFKDRWVGHPVLNRRWKVHRSRIQLAEALCRWRRYLRRVHQEDLARDGYVVISQFLPDEGFIALLNEVEDHLESINLSHPFPCNKKIGFQPKKHFPGGFDRFDGGTLNRFLKIDSNILPRAADFAGDRRLEVCSLQVTGLPMDQRKVEIYLTVHGEEALTPDLQKELHRDTFFRAVKFWYFLWPVTMNDGPFEVVPGSHKIDSARLCWEQKTAEATIRHLQQPDVSGSFRIREETLTELGLPAPLALTCPANTLVLADVFAFHRRGAARPGTQRLAIYGWNRPYPFLPITW